MARTSKIPVAVAASITLPASLLEAPNRDWIVTSYSGHRTHEGIAYRATLAWKGTVVGSIEDAGDGGMIRVHIDYLGDPFRIVPKAWGAFVAAVPLASLARLIGESISDETLQASREETVALMLVEEQQLRQRLDRLVKRGSTPFLAPGESVYPGGAFRVVKASRDTALETLDRKYPAPCLVWTMGVGWESL